VEAKSLNFNYITRHTGSKRNVELLKISQLRTRFSPILEPSHRIRLILATIMHEQDLVKLTNTV
jgi:hypothetical protein